jgi:hypothetical protein
MPFQKSGTTTSWDSRAPGAASSSALRSAACAPAVPWLASRMWLQAVS